ncbi:FAD/NAD(P)-binding oxidoreductase [Mumia sp. zg.B53]|uniref:FAD/NAD(P)-binding oxidoreductase n=1 Tax=Mumia sp. zg.B53 TaxID=2855449 RepID=UPI0027E27628|nr:FAD/NAD(P)-binding oxidoreductase [Mumia sp. zg.B53]
MDVLVIGAGPAGMAAAHAARAAGATVRVLDASDGTGGQYWRHLPASRPAARERVLHHQWDRYRRLHQSLQSDPGVTVSLEAHVWAIGQDDAGLTVHVSHGDVDGTGQRTETLRPQRLVLATGAHDRTLPVPGWTLPGVVTAGAAQALAKGERLAIGERVVVAGSGPFLLPVTASLLQAGASVVGVHEAARPRRLAREWLARPWELVGTAHKVSELAGYARHQVRGRVPYRTGSAVVRIHGEGRVEGVTVADVDDRWQPVAGTESEVSCDAVCLGHGFVPRLELAIAAGCGLTDQRFVAVDAHQRTTVAGVLAAGELTQIGGVDLALAEGEIAGWVAGGGDPSAAHLSRARRARSRSRRFADRIEAAHGIGPGWTRWLDDDTVVCRCEEVGYGTLTRVASDTSSVGLRSLKLTTRAGLGLCQGRVCGRTVETILAAASGRGSVPFADHTSTDRRPIAVPVRVGDLARPASPDVPSPSRKDPA